MYHLMSRPGVKFVVATFRYWEAPALWTSDVLVEMEKRGVLEDKVYGEDYVIFPFYPGMTAAVAAFAADVHKLCTTDYYGNPIETLPMMDDIRTGDDFDLVLVYGRSVGAVEVWSPVYETTIISTGHRMALSSDIPYIRAGIFHGGVYGTIGAAAYEVLLDEIGLTAHGGGGVRGYPATTFGNLYMLFLIALGNVVYWRRRLTGGE
jgi:hypothetical protein